MEKKYRIFKKGPIVHVRAKTVPSQITTWSRTRKKIWSKFLITPLRNWFQSRSETDSNILSFEIWRFNLWSIHNQGFIKKLSNYYLYSKSQTKDICLNVQKLFIWKYCFVFLFKSFIHSVVRRKLPNQPLILNLTCIVQIFFSYDNLTFDK